MDLDRLAELLERTTTQLDRSEALYRQPMDALDDAHRVLQRSRAIRDAVRCESALGRECAQVVGTVRNTLVTPPPATTPIDEH